MTNQISPKCVYLAIILFTSLTVGSCSEDDSPPVLDDPEEPAVPSVETLVSSLAANDALSIDAEGNIYASNFGVFSSTGGDGTKVLKITAEGEVSDFVTGLNGPLGNVFDALGNFYLVDDNNGTDGDLIKIDASGARSVVTTISGWPSGLTVDGENNVYVANYFNPTIHRITPLGEVSTFASDSRLAGCVGIVVDDSGNLLLGNYNNGMVLSVSTSGTVQEIATISGVVENFGIGYISYYDGFIYATGIGDNRVYRVSLDGSVAIFAGNGNNVRVDGPLLQSSFVNPNGIAIDTQNEIIYILDWGANALRRIQL